MNSVGTAFGFKYCRAVFPGGHSATTLPYSRKMRQTCCISFGRTAPGEYSLTTSLIYMQPFQRKLMKSIERDQTAPGLPMWLLHPNHATH